VFSAILEKIIGGITSLSPAGNASGKTDTTKKCFNSHKTSKKTGVAGQVQKNVSGLYDYKTTSLLSRAIKIFLEFFHNAQHILWVMFQSLNKLLMS